MNTTSTKTHDLGNGDSVSTGYFFADGVFTAMTRADSRDFKTEKGAIAWLARQGYTADGSRQNSTSTTSVVSRRRVPAKLQIVR